MWRSVSWAATWLINKHDHRGDIQAFIQYVRSFTQPITQIANISNVLQQTMAAAERVFEFLAEAEEVPDTSEPARFKGPIEGRVEFKNVHFGYSPDKIIINDFSRLRPNPVRRSPSSVPPAPARPPWSSC